MDDAKLYAKDVDTVILVGGSTRTPLVQQIVEEKLGQQPLASIDPDLCVAMGAAIQGGLVAGLDVGPVLVDITPHTLGVRCLSCENGVFTNRHFAKLIPRNTSLPAKRSHIFYTHHDGQIAANFDIHQGEHADATLNEYVGAITLEGLDESAEAQSEIVVRFDLDVNGTLTAKVVERATLLETALTIDNAITRFRAENQAEAKQRLATVLGMATQPESDYASGGDEQDLPQSTRERIKAATELISRAGDLLPSASEQDRVEISGLVTQLRDAIAGKNESEIDRAAEKLDDVLFYLQDV